MDDRNLFKKEYSPYLEMDLSPWKLLVENYEPESAVKGTIIEQQYDYKNEVILIKDGIASAFFTLSDGQERIRGLMGPGMFFGTRSCMSGEPYNTSLAAFSNIEFWRIPGNAFLEAIRSDNSLFMSYVNYSSYLSLNSLRRGEVNALPNNTVKICALFLSLGDYLGKISKTGQVIPVKLTHDSIAKLIYSDRVTVSQIISTMEKNGLLLRDYGFFVIPSRENLEDFFFRNMK